MNVGVPEQRSVSAWEFESDLYTDLPGRWHTTRHPGREVEAQVRDQRRERARMRGEKGIRWGGGLLQAAA
ncbi:hypothetical protein GCM10010211_46210 [Streptomyces albospinus]|uniref:Uncharacterized protein n=1 Tax=Streptomyces albospinus TaxID=285515 RepID=A0ABQ2V9U0_9ACTN|nr:hypothetical protein [Streptomyces albospinus]GGU75017.1 hypothetical protein GCM10010211_46210 [Streptomyces albospinus]